MLAGGTGETFLYRDKQSGEQVAVKLIRRPLPKVIQANILREIMVRPMVHPLPAHDTLEIPKVSFGLDDCHFLKSLLLKESGCLL